VNRKPEINLKRLENDFLKNREIKERMARLKMDDKNRPVMGEYLVYEDGRFRKPGSSYIIKKELKGDVIRRSTSS
jgi:hypothetical protein